MKKKQVSVILALRVLKNLINKKMPPKMQIYLQKYPNALTNFSRDHHSIIMQGELYFFNIQ